MPKTILMLAANPKGTQPLRLDEEVREIDSGLRVSKQRDQFRLEQRWAVRPADLRRALLEYEPEIVHFAGHGSGEAGIQLEDKDGNISPVSAETLADLFSLFPKIECVFLNACYTEVQADAIVQHVEHVIGMSHSVSDRAAIEFAVGFYDGIGAGKPYDFAYKFGCIALRLAGIGDGSQPILKSKKEMLELLEIYNQLRTPNSPPLNTPLSVSNKEMSKPPASKSTMLTDDELLRNLLSNNINNIRSSFEIISKTERLSIFQEKLLDLFLGSTTSYQQRFAIAKAFAVIGDPRDLEETVLIPSGEFWLGSDVQYIQSMIEQKYRYFSMDETPLQSYSLSAYRISKYPVTNQQYAEFLHAMPGHVVPTHWPDRQLPIELASHPVTHVSWSDAVAYARWRGGRLPTEFEWEKAARGNTKWRYPWGDKFDREKCNVQLELNGITTTPVGAFLEGTSPYGIMDMAGNVWEWTSTGYSPFPSYSGPNINFDDSYYVTRGGSHYNVPAAARCNCRFPLAPRAKYNNLGFRIVLPTEIVIDGKISSSGIVG